MKDETRNRKKKIYDEIKDDSGDIYDHKLEINEYKQDANNRNINNLQSKLQPEDVPKQVPVPKGDNVLKIDSLRFHPESEWLQLLRLPSIIVFGMLAGYAIGACRYNVLLLLPVAHVVFYVFMRHVSAYKRSLENLFKRKFNTIDNNNAIKGTESLSETVEWLNYIIRKTWEVGEEGVSAHIFTAVNEALADKRPRMLTSLRLRELTLGTRPPVVTSVRHVETEEGMCLEFAIEFTPVQTDRDILVYFGEERRHWNTCIELVATVGFVTLPVLVRNFVFTGVFRAEAVMGQKLPFVERLQICALEKPTVDFELYFLGMADVMDLPYLARAIRAAIDMAMDARLVAPNRIEVVVRPLTGQPTRVVGVAHVFIGGAKTRDEQTSWVELGVNGEIVGRTKKRTGAYPVFDESLWVDVIGTEDNGVMRTRPICNECKGGANKTNQVTVVSLPLPLQPIEVTFISGTARFYGQIQHTRDWHAEQLYCGGGETSLFLDVSMRLFPVVAQKTKHAVFVMTVSGVKGLRAADAPLSKLYSTHCRVTVERRNAAPDSPPEYVRETRRSFSTRDPSYNEMCRFFLREYNEFVLRLRIISEADEEEIGRADISVASIIDGPMRCSLTGVVSGEIELDFRVYHIDLNGICYLEGAKEPTKAMETDAVIEETINMLDNNTLPITIPGGYIDRGSENQITTPPSLSQEMCSRLHPVDYTQAYEITLVSIDTDGSFYLVVETRHMNWKSPCFASVLPVAATVVVPLTRDETCVRLRLFQMLERGDVLLDDVSYDFIEPRVQFAHVALCLVSLPCDIERVIDNDTSPAAKIIQFDCIDVRETMVELNEEYVNNGGIVVEISENVKKITGDLTVEITTDYGSIVQDLPAHCTLVCGGRPPVCRVFRMDEQQDVVTTLATFMLPLHTTIKPLQLSSTLVADIRLDVRRCSVDYPIRSTAGLLELYLIKVVGIPAGCNPYLKIYCNDQKIHKTAKKFNETNPVFNETCKIRVDRNIDVISCFLNDYSAISNSRIIAYFDIPLLNIKPGYFKYSIQFKDYISNLDSNILLHFIACFVPTSDVSSVDIIESSL